MSEKRHAELNKRKSKLLLGLYLINVSDSPTMESYHNKSYRMEERLLEEEFILPHIASAPLRQVDLGRRSKNNPHFLPCRFCSLFFLFRKGSRGCKKNKTIKSQHQLNIKHGPGSRAEELDWAGCSIQTLWLWPWEMLDGASST